MNTIADVLEGRARYCVIEADCLDVMRGMPDRCVDHAITDPPYSKFVHRKVRSSGRNGMPDAAEFGCNTRRSVDLGFTHLSAPVRRGSASQFSRLTRRWVATFSDVETCHLWRMSLAAAGMDYVRTAEWRRLNGAPQFTGDRPAQSFETITLAHQPGRKRWNGGGKQGVYEFAIVQNRGGKTPREHTTPKPLELMLALVEDFTDPDDLIFDGFAGSGTTGCAALRLGRRCILIEKEPKYAALCRERLAAEEKGSTLHAQRAGQEVLFR